MKYIIFKHGALSAPMVFPDHVVHSDVSLGPDFTPVSAGFFVIKSTGSVQVLSKPSESLGLRPAYGDEELLEKLLNNSGTYAFLNLNEV